MFLHELPPWPGTLVKDRELHDDVTDDPFDQIQPLGAFYSKTRGHLPKERYLGSQ